VPQLYSTPRACGIGRSVMLGESSVCGLRVGEAIDSGSCVESGDGRCRFERSPRHRCCRAVLLIYGPRGVAISVEVVEETSWSAESRLKEFSARSAYEETAREYVQVNGRRMRWA
jgi:hypothetical protein